MIRMARRRRARKPHRLTDLQLEVMDVVWTLGGATVTEVHREMQARTGLARKTIGTLLFRLEKQGALAHREQGREYVYDATISRELVERATVGDVLGTLFHGDVAAMVEQALAAQDEVDVNRVRAVLDRWESDREWRVEAQASSQ